MPTPPNPKIYHITHLENLAGIVDDVIWSDAERIERDLNCTVVGMSEIKRRRLEDIEVDCRPGTMVGEYVPFYFCPRSIMLYILHMGNSPDLSYRGGQRPILHLQADLDSVFEWLEENRRGWAVSNGNAGAYYTTFQADRVAIGDLDWDAIRATDWRNPDIKEHKQAEFLVYQSFPWELIESIGVYDQATADTVEQAISKAAHRPRVRVQRNWYY